MATGSFANDLHVSLAVVSVAAVVGAVIESGTRALTGRPPGRISAAVPAIVVVVLGMTAAGGLAMLIRGERPGESLHFLYAALSLVLVPFGDALTARADPRRRAMVRLVAALIALGVTARLFGTG